MVTPTDLNTALEQLRDWTRLLRPRPGEAADARLLEYLQLAAQGDRERTREVVATVLAGLRPAETLASAGILGDQPLRVELFERVTQRLLPPISSPESLAAAIEQVFDQPGDGDWLAAIPDSTWSRLQAELHLEVDPATPVPAPLARAMRVLAHRIAALGLRPALTTRVAALGVEGSPFLELSNQVLAYLHSHGDGLVGNEPALLRRCLATLDECRGRVAHLRANKHLHGTSLELTALSMRLEGLIERLALLLQLTDPAAPHAGRPVGALLVALVRAEDQRHHLLPLVRQHTDLLLFQIVEHAARSGAKYIANSRAEYWRFLLSSLAGGLIVAFFAVAKVKLTGLDLSPAGHALAYSINYAACFVLIYVTGATLATKQPAVTAHTLAATLDRTDGTHDLSRLAGMVARAWRSQLVSLVGNLAAALPMGLLLAAGWRAATGHALVDPQKAAYLLHDVHPWDGPTLWYAAIAGVFLFATGLISGWIDNGLIYGQVPARIRKHPWLLRLVGARGTTALAKVTDAKAGALIGNVALGFMLGTTGTVGVILGLPLDIRHIAFGSANLAMGIDGLGWSLSWSQGLVLAAGVGLIGLVNLFVSFGLAVLIAIESRSLSWREDRQLMRSLVELLVRRPFEFVLPPRDDGREGGVGRRGIEDGS